MIYKIGAVFSAISPRMRAILIIGAVLLLIGLDKGGCAPPPVYPNG